jgi:hypothetical protein
MFKDELKKKIISEALAKNSVIAKRLFSVLISLRGPIHIDTLLALLANESAEVETLKSIILASHGVLLTIHGPNGLEPLEALKNAKTTVVHRRRGLFKRICMEQGVILDKLELSSRLIDYHLRLFEIGDENEFEELDTYHKLHFYHHLAKTQP